MDEIVYDAAPSPMTLASIKSMPSHPDAERSVLSAMMLSPEVLESALVELSEVDFFVDANRIVFAAMRTMFERGIALDPISLADYLTSNEQLERAGGIQSLARLGEDSFAIASWKHHADMLHRDATLRLMIDASAKIANLAANAPEDTKEVVETAEKMLLDVTNRDIKTSYVRLEDAMVTLYDELGRLAQQDGETVGIQTGFPAMDRMFLGLRAGQMVVVGARPGVGKTSFALNLAVRRHGVLLLARDERRGGGAATVVDVLDGSPADHSLRQNRARELGPDSLCHAGPLQPRHPHRRHAGNHCDRDSRKGAPNASQQGEGRGYPRLPAARLPAAQQACRLPRHRGLRDEPWHQDHGEGPRHSRHRPVPALP